MLIVAVFASSYKSYMQSVSFFYYTCSLLVQTGSGAHPASYPMGTEGSFPGG
jgi:hypothetical protein